MMPSRGINRKIGIRKGECNERALAAAWIFMGLSVPSLAVTAADRRGRVTEGWGEESRAERAVSIAPRASSRRVKSRDSRARVRVSKLIAGKDTPRVSIPRHIAGSNGTGERRRRGTASQPRHLEESGEVHRKFRIHMIKPAALA